MTSMNPDIKAQWVAALRSGQYEQGHYALCQEDSSGKQRFCCLGVLCELAAQAGVTVRQASYLDTATYQYGREATVLPQEVLAWANLGELADPVIGDGTLVWYNDTKGSSFNEIADLIEANL